MTSEVGMGSALMAVLLFLGGAFSLQNRDERKSPACEMSAGRRGAQRNGAKNQAKKQGRRRSIPSTTLPAPDIEIGSRHPVNCSMTRIRTGMCEPVHTRRRKIAGGDFVPSDVKKISRQRQSVVARRRPPIQTSLQPG